MTRRNKSKKAGDNRYSLLGEHHRQGKALVPPLANLVSSEGRSWRDYRLPELLWASLLVAHLPRSGALAIFRTIGEYIHNFKDAEAPDCVTHSSLGKLSPRTLQDILGLIVANDDCRQVLKPLLLLDDLPSKEAWIDAIGVRPDAQDWPALMVAVGKTLDHQSQESTDCRWLRVVCKSLAGKMCFCEGMEETVKELANYPNYGDMRKVRPSVRAMEIGLDSGVPLTDRWAQGFWAQCLAETPCLLLRSATTPNVVLGTTREQVAEVYDLLVEHCFKTTATTAVDARHDTAFGMGLFSLTLLHELLRVGASQAITARIGLRTLAECFITLAYLVKKDDGDLWRSHRVFGAGQAKLQFLKLQDIDQPTHYVSAETLEGLANEDVWQEFLPIGLGHWDRSDLRKLSVEAGVKDQYDRYYAWTSSYGHAHWGSVRDAVFGTCANPLHRFHRIPLPSARTLPDVIPDACELVDKILECVSLCFPNFPQRVTILSPTGNSSVDV